MTGWPIITLEAVAQPSLTIRVAATKFGSMGIFGAVVGNPDQRPCWHTAAAWKIVPGAAGSAETVNPRPSPQPSSTAHGDAWEPA